jgi:hypothetical protein
VKFMLLIYSNMDGWEQRSPAEREAIYAEYVALRDADGMLGWGQLQPPCTATTVVVQGDEAVLSDGPFAETKEALGGYYLIEAESRDAAVELARRIPAARLGGAVEVRALIDL